MKCPQCDGFGKVSSHNGETWRQFTFRPHNSYPELSDGTARPVPCPECNGLKVVPDPVWKPEPVVDTHAEAEPAEKKPKKSP